MERSVSPPPVKRRKLAIPSGKGMKSEEAPSKQSTGAQDGSYIARIFSWNVNGIAPFVKYQDIKPITSYFQNPSKTSGQTTTKPKDPSLRAFLRRHSYPQILFLQEVKINGKDEKTQRAVQAAVNAKGLGEEDGQHTYTAHFVLPDDPHNARGFGGKVYGVASIIRDDFLHEHVSDVRTVGWDSEGRVQIVELHAHLIAVFNIYAVNGTTNPYKDPITGETKGTRHDRKLEFHKLLLQECKAYEERGWNVILGGDMNVAPQQIDGHPNLRTRPHQHILNRADFNMKFLGDHSDGSCSSTRIESRTTDALHGVDVWRRLNGPHAKGFTYYSRAQGWGTSCDRVDYFIVSNKLWKEDRIAEAEIFATPLERGPSDHVPISVAIRLPPLTESLSLPELGASKQSTH